MKRFLKKKWHHLPLGIVTVILLACLVTGSAFAAYNFLSFTTEIFVDEPLTVEFNLNGNYGGDSNWHPLDGAGDELTIDGSAGDVFDIYLRINNRADSALTVHTVITGQTAHFTCSGFPNGSIPESDGNDAVPEWQGLTTISINGDAPPATYNVTFTFTRE